MAISSVETGIHLSPGVSTHCGWVGVWVCGCVGVWVGGWVGGRGVGVCGVGWVVGWGGGVGR